MSDTGGNVFADIPATLPEEFITTLLAAPNLRIERIVSHGQCSPPGFWYDQPGAEWVIVLSGSASVAFDDGGEPRVLRRGDHLNIPARVRHRVAWTDPQEPTVWIAVHYR